MINEYPCKVHVGDYIVMNDEKKLKVSEVDWKYIYTENGSKFSYRHPDIKAVFVEEKVVEEPQVEVKEEEVQEEPVKEEEPKSASKKKAKKATEEKKEDEE